MLRAVRNICTGRCRSNGPSVADAPASLAQSAIHHPARWPCCWLLSPAADRQNRAERLMRPRLAKSPAGSCSNRSDRRQQSVKAAAKAPPCFQPMNLLSAQSRIAGRGPRAGAAAGGFVDCRPGQTQARLRRRRRRGRDSALQPFRGESFPPATGAVAFGQMYALDGLALFFKRFFLLAALIVLLMSVEFADRIATGIAEVLRADSCLRCRA